MKHDIAKLYQEYKMREINISPLIEEVKFIIYNAIKKVNIKIHSLSHRIKEFDSFLDKIKRKNITDPFNDIHDLIGFRIICLFLEDIKGIQNLLTNEFDVFDLENIIDGTSHDVFGYMASHYKVRFKRDTNFTGEAKDYSFEIQVRTIAQDAWASISHHLFYKHESHLPDNLRRDFHALSGLFYIADTHFSLLREEQFKYFLKSQKMDESPKSE